MRALEVSQLVAGYGEHTVITGVDLSLEPGDWYCLLGPNGSGKSTLLACLGGRLRPIRGSVRIADADLRVNPEQAKRRLGFAVQPEQLPDLLTGRQCLEIQALAQGLDHIDTEVLWLLDEFGLDKALDTTVDTWSLGMRQKLCVSLALLGDPSLVILDEAFNGLDPRAGRQLRDHLALRLGQRRCAVLLATHSLDLVARVATGAGWLHDGRLRRQWSGETFNMLRNGGPAAFERAWEMQLAPDD